jgi:hypothetical protein
MSRIMKLAIDVLFCKFHYRQKAHATYRLLFQVTPPRKLQHVLRAEGECEEGKERKYARDKQKDAFWGGYMRV